MLACCSNSLLIAVLVATLVVQWIIRLGVLVVAVGIAPIALALHGTPQTEGGAKLWWRTILGTVIMQAVALHTTPTIFLNPNTNPTYRRLSTVGSRQDPGLMRQYITQNRPNAVGTILRVIVVQKISRGLSRAISVGRDGVRAAGLRGFWEWYETAPAPLRLQVIAPLLSRLRSVLLRVCWFLELDRGTETLGRLAAKLASHRGLLAEGGPAYPVLFVLPNRVREQNLHRKLADKPEQTLTVATTSPKPAMNRRAGLAAGRQRPSPPHTGGATERPRAARLA